MKLYIFLFYFSYVCYATTYSVKPSFVSVTGTVGKTTQNFTIILSNKSNNVSALYTYGIKLNYMNYLGGTFDLNPTDDISIASWNSSDYNSLPITIQLPFEMPSFSGVRDSIIVAPHGLLLFDEQDVNGINVHLPNASAPSNCWAIGWSDYQLTPTSTVEWCVLSNKVAIYYTGLLEPSPIDGSLSPVTLRAILYPEGSIILDHDCFLTNKTIGWQDASKKLGQTIVDGTKNYLFGDCIEVGTERLPDSLPFMLEHNVIQNLPNSISANSNVSIVCSVQITTNIESEYTYVCFSPNPFFYPCGNPCGVRVDDIEICAVKVYKQKNTPPTISGPTNVLLDAEPFTVQYTLSDVNADNLNFQAINGPSGIFPYDSGLLDCSNVEKGDYDFTVRVVDDGSPYLSASLDVHISIVPEPIGIFLFLAFSILASRKHH